jgi:hypothetical protein
VPGAAVAPSGEKPVGVDAGVVAVVVATVTIFE